MLQTNTDPEDRKKSCIQKVEPNVPKMTYNENFMKIYSFFFCV